MALVGAGRQIGNAMALLGSRKRAVGGGGGVGDQCTKAVILVNVNCIQERDFGDAGGSGEGADAQEQGRGARGGGVL